MAMDKKTLWSAKCQADAVAEQKNVGDLSDSGAGASAAGRAMVRLAEEASDGAVERARHAAHMVLRVLRAWRRLSASQEGALLQLAALRLLAVQHPLHFRSAPGGDL